MTPVQESAMALVDYSHQTRWGVRGSEAQAWLQSQALTHSGTPNRIEPLAEGRWLMALSKREFWVMEPSRAADINSIKAEALAPGVWPLFCQHSHAWFVLYGAQKADAMAKVCGVDLRPEVFSAGMVAQTQVARVNAIVAHHHLDTDGSVFSLLCDSAAANYFQEVLLDAIREYNNE